MNTSKTVLKNGQYIIESLSENSAPIKDYSVFIEPQKDENAIMLDEI